MRRIIFLLLACAFLSAGCSDPNSNAPRRAEVLFLGHTSEHHHSDKYAPWLAVKLFPSGINLTYTTKLDDLNQENLTKYDGLIIYANYDTISASQEAALKDFVQGGKGLIPLHCATGCFKNSDWYIQAIGGQFKSHGTGRFAATIVNTDHALAGGLTPFETWDETYVHQRLNPDNIILTERVEGDHHEPYTWVRQEGKGRVFYTAYGHNDSTWKNPGFLNLVRDGVRWALGEKVMERVARLEIPDVSIYNTDSIGDYTQRYLVPREQEVLLPDQAQKLLQVPVDFDIKLFAAEPDITNPIAMAWDERGRLWIVESVDYPNTFVETDGQANDRIKICEDTDGDGKADKFTVFADSLNIPTSIVFANGGVIVSMAPDFVFLQDTDGDDKADTRKILISGWGKSDTHAGPSNLQYGFDNKIWGVLGYSGFNGTTDGRELRFGSGIYRFAPNGQQLEFLANSSNNTWGLGFSEDNNVFISTANNTHSAFYSMPAGYMKHKLPGYDDVRPIQRIDGHYHAHAMTPNLRQVDVMGGFTAAAGHHLYTARNFPKAYWNRIAFVNEPTVRLVHQAVIEPDGAGFREKDDWNLMASSDEWFGPVHSQVGPDGAVWVADWYNFIIQHNVFVPAQAPSEFILPFTEQPHGQGNAFKSPMRDVNHGRIYRIVYKKAKPYKPMTLSADDTKGLVAALRNDNMFWRMTAQRLLVESGNTSALPELYTIIGDPAVDAIGLNSPAVHALWALKGLGALDGGNTEAQQVVVKALSHPAAGVRKAAIAVLPPTAETRAALLSSGVFEDKDLNTRMHAFLAAAALPADEEIGKLLYRATLDKVNAADKWIAHALSAAAVTHREGFLAAAREVAVPATGGPVSAANGTAPAQAGDAVTAARLDQLIADLLQKNEDPLPTTLPPPAAGTAVVNISVVPDLMQYNKKLFSVKSGQQVTLQLDNPDGMQHNLLIIQPGSLPKVGAAADKLATDPKGAAQHYVPDIPEVLHATKLVSTGEKITLTFTAPAKAGDYPFVCTFPGHWRGMNGIMRVID